MLYPRQGMKLRLFQLSLLFTFLAAPFSGAQESPASTEPNSVEVKRLETIRYGTETEIGALVQTLKSEGAEYLDGELSNLVHTTRNRNILVGVFSFFGDRNKPGLEDRALRAIDERDDESNETVLAAVDYLGQVKERDGIRFLKELLDYEEQRFIGSAIRALGRIGGGNPEEADGIAEYLIDYYENHDTGSENQRLIVTALGETKSKKGVSFLNDIAGNDDQGTVLRMATLESLSKIGDPAGLDAVLEALSSQDANVRSTAVAALGPFSGPEVDAAILEAFRDSYYRTRIAAAQAAQERQLTEAVPYLRYRAEQDEVPQVKDEAIRALGSIATREAISAIDALFSERKNADRVRILAAEMLIGNNADEYAMRVIIELDEAKTKNQTTLYNGFLRVIGAAKTSKIEDLTRRFLSAGDIIEKSYGLDMAVNNEFRSLEDQIRPLAASTNAGLARKTQSTLEKLGLNSPEPGPED